MPIRIPEDLPAHTILKQEGVMVMSDVTADRQDIRPIKIGLLNLMPVKIETETQFARLIGATPLQIDLTLISLSKHISKNTSAEHMKSFYKPFDQIYEDKFDGLIVTGAPIEHLEFEQVDYWDEITDIFDWTITNVHSTFAVCWGAMAMLNYFFKLKKVQLDKKIFGCYHHKNVAPTSHILRGFSDKILVPVSRWSEISSQDLRANPNLKILIDSDEIGPCLLQDNINRTLFIFNHFEYDSNTLKEEYNRDLEQSKSIGIPQNYFPGNNINNDPENSWRSHAHLLYGNWINEIYQTTPYEISEIGKS